MLLRVALVLLLLTGLFVAGHLGVNLPWNIATTTPEPASKTDSATAEKQASPADAAQSALEETTAALSPAPSASGVEIDIARISPDGVSVFAGRAEPDTYVTVLENGKPAGSVKAGQDGEWSLSTEHKFASADPKLTYQTSKTPPPAPEPPKVARAEPAKSSAASVAGDVMRKFENLVSEAREEAAKKKSEAEQPAELAVTPGSDTPAAAASGSSAGEASTTTADASGTASATAASKPDTASSESPAFVSPPGRTEAIPVPIMFVYNEATLTPEGQRAANLLVEYLTLKGLSAVELTGHADERGTDEYNFDLSRDRLETVSHILREGGYGGELKLTPKGKSEPYAGVDRTAYRGEALYQLDRRVELRVTR
jgi:outer membrane protein OmpA-like peptidoglycan-associated protein